MLRFDAPFQMNLRYVTEDVEVAGMDVAAGSLVRQALGSANRDPERLARPRSRSSSSARRSATSRSDSGRTSASARPLARLQGQVVVETLLRRLPGLRLADPSAPPDLRADITNRNLNRLPLAFDPA